MIKNIIILIFCLFFLGCQINNCKKCHCKQLKNNFCCCNNNCSMDCMCKECTCSE